MNLRSGIKPHANCMYYKKEQEMMKKRVLCTRCQKGKGGRNGKRDRRRHTSGFHGRNRNFI